MPDSQFLWSVPVEHIVMVKTIISGFFYCNDLIYCASITLVGTAYNPTCNGIAIMSKHDFLAIL
jgi:hypothetical protein